MSNDKINEELDKIKTGAMGILSRIEEMHPDPEMSPKYIREIAFIAFHIGLTHDNIKDELENKPKIEIPRVALP